MNTIVFFTVLGLFFFAKGIQLLNISTAFILGDVLFKWNSTFSQSYDVRITRDNTSNNWERVTGTQYTVTDALLYDSISIDVRLPGTLEAETMTYKVLKLETYVGDTVNISWPSEIRTWIYDIHHVDKVNRRIITYSSSGTFLDETKYWYFPGYDVTFEIKNITLDDAGYYFGQDDIKLSYNPWSDGGVVLIVHNNPLKPQILGDVNIMVGSYSELNCSSSSTTAPDYYARLRPLSYAWYVNNTQLHEETRETLRLRVFRDHKYNNYSCTARDKLESDWSDPVQIIPLLYDFKRKSERKK